MLTFSLFSSPFFQLDLEQEIKDHLRVDIETNLGIILKDQGDPDGAISKLEKVLTCSYAKSKCIYP
jgi:hypothetical protein